MSQLIVGDHVLAADNMYDRVYTFGHRVESTRAEYLQILPSGLELSADHMVFVLHKGAIPASMLKVGDHFVDGGGVVESIRKVNRRGVYAPFTRSGTIVANGVLASTYVSFQGSEVIKFGSLRTPFTYQWLAHSFHVPHRIWGCWLGMDDAILENGFSRLTEPSYKAAKWFLGQRSIAMAVLFVPFLMLVVVFGLLESMLLHPALAAVVMAILYTLRKVSVIQKQNKIATQSWAHRRS